VSSTTSLHDLHSSADFDCGSGAEPPAPNAGAPATQQQSPHSMTFFVTTTNPGKGGDLGGLAGADARCQTLAQALALGTTPGAPISVPKVRAP